MRTSTCACFIWPMREARYAGEGGHDLKTEPLGEVRPALVDDHDLGPAVGSERGAPAREAGVEALEELGATGLEAGSVLRGQSPERGDHGRRDGARVLRVQ